MANKLYCRRVDFRDTPEEAQFREEVRAWLDENLPDELQGHRGGAARFDGPEVRAWSRALYDGGWVGIAWPKEFGGRGLAPRFQAIYLEEEARAEAPPHVGVIGLGMAGPTIISRGTEEQKARYLTPLLAADEIWCQGFSEPGAGSDLAGVRTSARLEGDRFVLDGQKVWSSYAHIADYCILLARSDPGSERHAGLTYLIVDMHAPGVEVRPLTQITGEAEFNEIFLSGVEVPARERDRRDRRRLGRRHDDAPPRARHARVRARRAARGAGREAARAGARPRRDTDAARRDRARVDRAPGAPRSRRTARSRRSSAPGIPGPEGSILKLQWSEANQRVTALALDLLGPDAQLLAPNAPYGGYWPVQQLRSRGNTIEAGTSEILRNIVAERVLGLPRSR